MNRTDAIFLTSARARAMSASDIAREAHLPISDVIGAMRRVAASATGAERVASLAIRPETTFDLILSRIGRPSVASGLNGASSEMRTLYVPRPSILAWALDLHHPSMRSVPLIQKWQRVTGVASLKPKITSRMLRARRGRSAGDVSDFMGDVLPGTPGIDVARADDDAPLFGIAPPTTGGGSLPGLPTGMSPPGTPGVYRQPPTAHVHHLVKSGENPSLITYWVTGDTSPARWAELIDANPSKATVGTPGSGSYNFKSFTVGENILFPQAWNQFVSEAGDWGTKGVPYPEKPAAPDPTVPSGGGDDYTSSLPAGRIVSLKVELGGWGKTTGLLTTYPGAFDLTDVVDEAFHGAVAQFQGWSNATNGTTLRTDGRLDAPTANAIDSYAFEAAKGAKPPPLPDLSKGVYKAPPPDVPAPGGTWKYVDGAYKWFPDSGGTPPPGPPPSASSGGGGGAALVVAALALGLYFVK